jgi:hypothetical protein
MMSKSDPGTGRNKTSREGEACRRATGTTTQPAPNRMI